MGRTILVAVLAASATLPWGASPLRGQALTKPVPPLLALSLNELNFGSVLPGIPSSVPVHDPRNSGLFQVQGPPGTSVRVEFVLPGALATGGGALLPLRFGASDGYADFSRGRPPRGLVFDPHAPVIGALGPNGDLYLRLGGTVMPSRTQPGGDYRATIFMTVYDTGI